MGSNEAVGDPAAPTRWHRAAEISEATSPDPSCGAGRITHTLGNENSAWVLESVTIHPRCAALWDEVPMRLRRDGAVPVCVPLPSFHLSS